MRRSYDIFNGPSREDLFDSLRLIGKLNPDEMVSFVVVSNQGKKITIQAQVLGIAIHEFPGRQYPDHQKEVWKLQIFAYSRGDWADFPGHRPTAFYDTQTRKGKMVLA